MSGTLDQLRELLDEKVEQYENPDFIEKDPISIPHRYTLREDIEIAAFLSSTIAWGNRKAIVKAGNSMMQMLGDSPYDFLMSADEDQFEGLKQFVYRTFQQEDLMSFCLGLRRIYRDPEIESLESLFTPREGETIRDGIARFRSYMLEEFSYPRSQKHLANVAKGAAGKRINMFLRWMVRSSARGVDFGFWRSIKPNQLIIPLDVHTSRTSRALGLLSRSQNDWLAAEELTNALRQFSPSDPVRYDFALFSIGIIEGGIVV